MRRGEEDRAVAPVQTWPHEEDKVCPRMLTTDSIRGGVQGDAKGSAAPGGAHVVRICIVDDQVLVREAVAALLRTQRDLWVVGQCSTAEEALNVLASQEVDLVLLEPRIERRNGARLLRQLKEAGFAGRVLILASAVEDAEAFQLASLGAAGILLKESPADLLVKCVRKVLAGELWYDQRYLKAIVKAGAELARGDRGALFSERERQVLRHVVEGRCNKEIAGTMGVTEGVVKGILQRLYRKTGVHTRNRLVRLVLEQHREELERLGPPAASKNGAAARTARSTL